MNATQKSSEQKFHLTKPKRRSSLSAWEKEAIRKRAERDAEEIIRKARVRETLREHFKSIRLENRSE